MRRPGFTLIELLVVLGILAVLIGILLPVFGRARESANRAACLSNMRQFGTAFLAYAQQNKGKIPIGYLDQMEQQNYLLNYNDTGGGFKTYFTMAGILYQTNRLPSVNTYFCPSFQHPQWVYANNANNAVSNWWPPVTTNQGSKRHTRVAYGTRPVASWGARLVNGTWVTKFPSPMPKLETYRNKAMLTDIISLPSLLEQGHKQGINLLYADMSAKWVARSAFNDNLKKIPDWPFEANLVANNAAFLDLTKNPPTGVWADLDKQ
ncbi:MAG TPA: prepilin-type N-terminal cleavage/methylation domain-containing protein [Tepidisphaeraceae bacterium]|jgi:prepilin-type N-terminal cleavage/methylation domain-containing protein|nr:prepilin-type N-terminal cleavage/methylation domain-containing protein [Tepidisphaeraceae bacterium]